MIGINNDPCCAVMSCLQYIVKKKKAALLRKFYPSAFFSKNVDNIGVKKWHDLKKKQPDHDPVLLVNKSFD